MFPIALFIIIITIVISYKGIEDKNFFEKYKFNISMIKTRKEYIRVLSSGFLHADFMHLFFNMLSLYLFQGIVVFFFGNLGFISIYLGSLLLGNLLSLYIYKNRYWYSAVGASGAISGIIFSAIAVAPNEIEINFLPGWVFGTLYFGYSVYMMLYPKQWDNTGHSAHLGGAVFGLIFVAVQSPSTLIQNWPYLTAMSLPLGYMAYRIFIKKDKF